MSRSYTPGQTIPFNFRTYADDGVTPQDADETPTVSRLYKDNVDVSQSATITKRAATTGVYDVSITPTGVAPGNTIYLEVDVLIDSIETTWKSEEVQANQSDDTIRVKHDGDDIASGAALKAAVEGASAGQIVRFTPGNYDLDSSLEITVPIGVRVVGPGRNLATVANVENAGLRLLDQAGASDFSVRAESEGNGIGIFAMTGAAVAIERMTIYGDWDAVACLASTETLIRDSHLVSKTDALLALTNDQLHLENVILESTGEMGGAAKALAVIGNDARVTGINVTLLARGPSEHNYGIFVNDVSSNQVVELSRSSILVAGDGAEAVHKGSASAVVRMLDCEFDRSLVVGDGTLLDVVNPLSLSERGSENFQLFFDNNDSPSEKTIDSLTTPKNVTIQVNPQ